MTLLQKTSSLVLLQLANPFMKQVAYSASKSHQHTASGTNINPAEQLVNCNTLVVQRRSLIKPNTLWSKLQQPTAKPFQEIANEMLPKISKSSIQNLLAEEGYHRQAVQKVPYLTKKHKVDHMQWARLYRMFNWEKEIWSDESYIYLGDDCGKVYVTQCTNEELNENCLVTTFKESPVRVMIWACIMKGKKGLLIVLEYPGRRGGGMNSAWYKDQLLEGVLASLYS